MKLKEMLKTNEKSGTEKRIERKRGAIDKLDSMSDYQRPINMKFVEEKSQDGIFKESDVSIVLVSVREDGSMRVMDGQHTVAILKKRGYTTAECELRYGLTIQEENDWFNRENTKRQPQSSKRTLTSQINGTYEENKAEQDFYSCLKSIGFKLDIYGEEAGNVFKICCPSSLLDLYKTYVEYNKTENFIECLDLVKTTFNGDPISLQWGFLKGMFIFYETYKDEFDRKRFILTLSKVQPKTIKSRIELDTYTKKTELKYARFFVNEYNANLAKNKKLKMSKLED